MDLRILELLGYLALVRRLSKLPAKPYKLHEVLSSPLGLLFEEALEVVAEFDEGTTDLLDLSPHCDEITFNLILRKATKLSVKVP